MMGRLLNIALCSCPMLVASSALAQWQPVLLNPNIPGYLGRVNAVFENRQAGFRGPGGPGFWRSTPETWQTLSSGLGGTVNAMWGDVQGGNYSPPGGGIWASIWHGTPESQEFLHPGGIYSSTEIFGVHENQQVGWASPEGAFRFDAALWHGTAESFRLLSPPGSAQSKAVATDGVHQYGWADYAPTPGEQRRAVKWSGTAESVVSLHPDRPGLRTTEILGATAVRQAGFLRTTTSDTHAVMWAGTAESMVDIHPESYALSQAWGACDTAVVGYANPGGFQVRPGIWMEPDFQFQELPRPAGYEFGFATSVTFFEGRYYIGGFLQEGPFGPPHPIVWIGIPAPSAAAAFALAATCIGTRRRR